VEGTATELVQLWTRVKPNELALVDVSQTAPRTWTWSELSAHADGACAVLARLGIEPGEPVAMLLPNWGESVAAVLAVLRLGAVPCPLLPALGPRETGLACARASARLFLVSREAYERVHGGCGIGRVEQRLGGGRRELLAGCAGDFAARPLPWPAVYGQLAFTSGTTGEGRCVLRRADTLTAAARMAAGRLGITAADRVLVPCPLAHHSGFLYGMWLAWTAGCAQVVHGGWDARRALAALREWGGTFAQVAPPMLVDLAGAIEGGCAPPPALRVCVATGGAVPPRLAERASRALGAAVCRAWGSTETCMGTLSAPSDPPERQWSTDGRPLDGVRVRVVDDGGRALGPGEHGHLEVWSPCLFDGYGRDAERDRSAFTEDGWYRSGDLAVRDDSGWVRIAGRVTDVVNRGGEKVPVVAIEALLFDHEAVADVAITAVRDDRLGERACAFVVLEPGHALSLADVRAHLEGCGVTRHYWPERLEVVDSLPRNGAGKVRKSVLRQSVEGEGAAHVR
jgi:cyclohexanecarboxylate-CoA ligase